MNVQLNMQISQGSVATDLRGGGKFYSSFLYDSSRNTTVIELLKSVHSCRDYPKNKTCTLFVVHGITVYGCFHHSGTNGLRHCTVTGKTVVKIWMLFRRENVDSIDTFYRAMHFSANARYWDRMSSVRLSVTLVDCNHIGWKSWKLITRTTSPTPSLFVAKRRSA